MTAKLDTSSPDPTAEPATSETEFENFVYVLSHDIRASVRASLELPQWIEEDLVEAGVIIDAPLAEKFELMHRHMHRLDLMLSDLLDYSRVGRMQSPRRIDLAAVLGEVLRKFPLPVGFTLHRDIRTRGPYLGESDAERLLAALISNAVKHHDQDSGRIELHARDEVGFCVLTLSDDGPGIPEAHRDAVFDPMKMLKSRDELEGSGMGLTMVRKIVQHYGGALRWTMPAGGRGTTLELRLPIG